MLVKRSTSSVLKKLTTSAIMSGAGVEELYKNYGILADAGDKVSEVSVTLDLVHPPLPPSPL